MVYRRSIDGSVSVPSESQAVPEVFSFGPIYIDPKVAATDSISRAARGAWRDRQSHGRLAYETMMRHPAVSAPFGIITSILKAVEASFTPPNSDPNDIQKQMSDFLNDQLRRLAFSGQATDGWTKMVDGVIRNGLEFGFGLAEMGVKVENWHGRPMKQVSHVRTLPQSSLDNGEQPLEEFGELAATSDPRYRCFDFDNYGNLTGVWQYRNFGSFSDSQGKPIIVGSSDMERWWRDADLNRILHYTHNGGDGNIFGEPILYSAFYPWSDLYIQERLETNFIAINSTPFLTANYDADVPSPAVHQEIKDAIQSQDPNFRVLVARRTQFGSVSGSNDAYTKHIKQFKEEKRRDISQSILVPMASYRESDEKDQNVRDILQMFVKFTLPAIFKEIEEFMTAQFGRRLIDSNYSNVEIRDYPRFKFRVQLDNDVRLVTAVLPQLIPYLDSDRLGEALEALLPGFRSEHIPKDHQKSVGVMRPTKVEEGSPDSKNRPPNTTGTKSEGGEGDGSTLKPGKVMDTAD